MIGMHALEFHHRLLRLALAEQALAIDGKAFPGEFGAQGLKRRDRGIAMGPSSTVRSDEKMSRQRS